MSPSTRKSTLALGLAGLLSAAAFTLAIAVPTPAEARVVCREGWGWQRDRCVQVRGGWHRGHGPRYVVGGYLPRDVAYRPVPRERYYRLQRVPVGYSYVMIGNDILLLDRHRRVVRIYD